jgi:Holliday junction resolvasome RuvABC endonuclease subunit
MTPADLVRGSLTLAVHPVARGMGWIAFRGPAAPYDWGMTFPKREVNSGCMRKMEQLFDRFQPEGLVLEDNKRPGPNDQTRIDRLYVAIIALAVDRGVPVAIYTRSDVRTCFASVGAVSRREVAEAVARHCTALADLLPRPRKRWESEDRRMSIFAAAALAVTHYRQDGYRSPIDLSEGWKE